MEERGRRKEERGKKEEEGGRGRRGTRKKEERGRNHIPKPSHPESRQTPIVLGNNGFFKISVELRNQTSHSTT
jgi:hypothetical protein